MGHYPCVHVTETFVILKYCILSMYTCKKIQLGIFSPFFLGGGVGGGGGGGVV